jgi:glycosyltransferase involved in cell wall biosynthesis
MKILVVHPTGNEYVRALLAAFSRAGMLSKFVTTIALKKDSAWLNCLPSGFRKQIRRRVFPLDRNQINTRPLLELCRNLFMKLDWAQALRHESGFACIDRVYADLDKSVALNLKRSLREQRLTAVYAFEGGALKIFQEAKALGLPCIYDLPIAYWETGQSLMREEAERLPEWKATLEGGVKDSQQKLNRKTAELRLADVVVVPGKFVLDSLPDWAKDKKIIVAPFGSPEAGPERVQWNDDEPLRVLFVGSMGQRKGLGDLCTAVKMLDPAKIELVAMGNLLAPVEFYAHDFGNFSYEMVRPHGLMLEFMRSCDVFCLPSIVEGRALVMQAAMSQGLPVLITPNTGGEDLVIEGETGFLVPIRSPEQIAERLNWFIANRRETFEMGKKAKAHAAGYTWEAYGDLIIKELRELYV